MNQKYLIAKWKKWKMELGKMKKKTLTKTKYQEIFAQILSFAAQLIVAIFLITVLIWSIF